MRHPEKFDLIFADKASKLRVWRPQPIDDAWLPAGDVVTVGTKRPPSPNHVWLLPATCMEAFTGYHPKHSEQPCNTRVLGGLVGLKLVRSCEAGMDAQGALGTVWLAKDPCSVPQLCPRVSCLTVPGTSYHAQSSGVWCQ